MTHNAWHREMTTRIINLRTIDRDNTALWNDVATGALIPIGPQLVFPAALWRSLRQYQRQWLRITAAAMTSRGSILTGRSAARIHEMRVVALSEETIEVALRSGGSSPTRLRNGDYTYRHARLRAEEITRHDGFLLTSPTRTFADIARYHGFIEGLVAIDGLLYAGANLATIAQEVVAMGRLKGVATVRRCLDHAITGSESTYESVARGLLIQAGIGPLTPQFSIGAYRADLAVHGWLLIEIDGDIKYAGADAESVRQREFARQKQISNRGYVFLRYSPSFLTKHPERFVAEVRSTLASRRPPRPIS